MKAVSDGSRGGFQKWLYMFGVGPPVKLMILRGGDFTGVLRALAALGGHFRIDKTALADLREHFRVDYIALTDLRERIRVG